MLVCLDLALITAKITSLLLKFVLVNSIGYQRSRAFWIKSVLNILVSYWFNILAKTTSFISFLIEFMVIEIEFANKLRDVTVSFFWFKSYLNNNYVY